MKKKVNILGTEVSISFTDKKDYISLTDIAKFKNPNHPADVIKNWTRSKETIAFLGLWEKINNPKFKLVEFDQFRNLAGFNSFVLPPQQWIEKNKTSCKKSKQNIKDHFVEVNKKVKIGSGTEREIEDIMLTRYACYLIAQNGDLK